MPNPYKNKNILHEHKTKNDPPPKTCNCRRGNICPLGGNCLIESVIYQAEVKDQNSNSEKYVGLTKNSFKQRMWGHHSSFRHAKNRKSTTLSEHVWSLKDQGIDFELNWSILSRARKYHPGSKSCGLCLREI